MIRPITATKARHPESECNNPEHQESYLSDQNRKPAIPTELLRTFVAVYELGSFSKAAQLLEISQPTVSAQMRRLEAMVGGHLVDRQRMSASLTERGLEVLKSARRLLSTNDQMLSQSRSGTDLQAVRVGIPNIFAGTLLPTIVNELRLRAPDMRPQICCDSSRGLLRSIRNGYLDLAFAFGEAVDMADADSSWPEEIVWTKAPELTWTRNLPVPLISSPNLYIVDRLAAEALEKTKRPFRITYSAYDFGARLAGAISGLGYLVNPRRLVPAALVIEGTSILPSLPNLLIGIFTNGSLSEGDERPLVTAIANILRSEAK
jgi:DNA-binding transcriptional LysR family regulator